MRRVTAILLAMLVTAPAVACPDSHRFETFSLPAPALGHAKRLIVYLPPGYDCGDARYPVLYANDGHDLFEWDPFAATVAPALDPGIADELARREAWYGSWRLDAQLDRAIAAGDLPPLMVVGIASDDGQRSRDLAPVPWDGSAEMWFDSLDAMERAFALPCYAERIRPDEERFLDLAGCAALVVEETRVHPAGGRGAGGA